MARLGDTVAELVRKLAAHGTDAEPLPEVQAFGANPGALRMFLHAPQALPLHAPLVVVLHGCGQTASGYAHGAGWIELADHFGFAVLCPEQVRANNMNRCFNWFEPGDIRRGSGEVASIAQMVARATRDHRLDPARVFVTGLSAGGAMAAAMLATYPELFAGGAIVAGLPYGAAAGLQEALAAMRAPAPLSAAAWGDKVRAAAPAPRRWPTVSVWHGDADATVAPLAADALALQWADVHGVSTPAKAVSAASGHRLRVWRGEDGAVVVEQHGVAGMGHGAPLSATGEHGWGAQGPYLLEVGLSSSLLTAQSWGLASGRTEPRGVRRARQPGATLNASASGQAVDVNQVISRALRSAGLLR